MAVERTLLTNDFSYLTDASGDYITVTDAPAQPLIAQKAPLVTPKSSLMSRDRHVLASSTGAMVYARSADTDIFARGGTTALISPKPSLITRRDSLIVDPSRVILPGIYAQTRYGYSSYASPLTPGQYAVSTYGQSSYA
jgi:hypothetical protein